MELHSHFQFVAPLRNAPHYYNAASIFFESIYYLAKIQYYTAVCMRHHQPNLLAKPVKEKQIAHGNGHAY